jgi:lysozyme
VKFIAQWEKFKPNAYFDHQRYSIGYGTKAAHQNERITHEEGYQRLLRYSGRGYSRIIDASRAEGIRITCGQAIALSSLAYNLGWPRFSTSIVWKSWLRQDGNTAEHFGKYRKAGGKILNGLVKRREAERQLFSNRYEGVPYPEKEEGICLTF